MRPASRSSAPSWWHAASSAVATVAAFAVALEAMRATRMYAALERVRAGIAARARDVMAPVVR